MTKRLILAVLVIFAFGQSIPGQAPATPKKIQTLIITGQNGHDWRGVTPELRRMLEDTGRFEVRVVEEFRERVRKRWRRTISSSSTISNAATGSLWWGDRANQALLDFVKNGKGLVMYHFSTAAFDGWTEYEKLSGGNWRPNQGHHSPQHDFVVKITDREHPITRGLKAELPQPHDELYANLRWQPEGTYHVLATAWDDHSLYGGKARQPIPGAGLDHPMLWTLQYGQGRVFGNALGHDVPAVRTPTFVATFTRGAEWAATGAVTLPVPPEVAAK